MRRLLLLILVCALAAGCGGGKSASDTFALDQTAACAKVQQRLAAIKRPPVTAQASNAVRKRESKALQRYAIKVDRTAPVTTANVTGPLGAPDTYLFTANVALAATDGGSGVAFITYRIDVGAPTGKNKRVAKSGVKDVRNEVTGYSVVQADSHDAATKMFKDNPMLQYPGAYIEVIEYMEMAGM